MNDKKFRMVIMSPSGELYYIESMDVIEFGELVLKVNTDADACLCFG